MHVTSGSLNTASHILEWNETLIVFANKIVNIVTYFFGKNVYLC